jgi:hypothetical protein
MGPGADLRVPFRRNADTDELQAGVTAAGLASIGGGAPLGRHLSLELRGDLSLSSQPRVDGADVVYGGALRVGIRAR